MVSRVAVALAMMPLAASQIHINPVPPPPPGSGIPHWKGPRLHVAHALQGIPYGGALPINGTEYTRLMYATPELGTYNMSPMISFHGSQLIAYWKNAPRDEDQPGQQVLFSQSSDGHTWTPTDGSNVLFPSMASPSNPNVALFAEPSVTLNGRLYVAASPVQFCVYPDPFAEVLLLRRVLDGLGAFGPVFWAAAAVPAGFEEASALQGVVGLADMDAETQADVALLADPLAQPCDTDRDETTKCEWCAGGCQPYNETFAPIENENTHYVVPGTVDGDDLSAMVDVILYRARIPGTINHLWASRRVGGPGAPWEGPVETNIADDVANINAGSFPDGRVFLVSNAMPSVFRDPLFVSVAPDGVAFTETHVAVSCEMDVFKQNDAPHRSDNGCLFRYQGGAKEGGCQYPQAVFVTQASVFGGLWIIFSLNKEDIWVAKLPYPF